MNYINNFCAICSLPAIVLAEFQTGIIPLLRADSTFRSRSLLREMSDKAYFASAHGFRNSLAAEQLDRVRSKPAPRPVRVVSGLAPEADVNGVTALFGSGPIVLKKSAHDRSGQNWRQAGRLSGRFWLRHWDQLG